jgi:biotin operon repressor
MINHTPPIIPCEHCGGQGSVPLGRDLQQTLARLTDQPQTAADLEEPGIGRTAINNRLVKLERLGLARAEAKRGKWRLWVNVPDEIPQGRSERG